MKRLLNSLTEPTIFAFISAVEKVIYYGFDCCERQDANGTKKELSLALVLSEMAEEI